MSGVFFVVVPFRLLHFFYCGWATDAGDLETFKSTTLGCYIDEYLKTYSPIQPAPPPLYLVVCSQTFQILLITSRDSSFCVSAQRTPSFNSGPYFFAPSLPDHFFLWNTDAKTPKLGFHCGNYVGSWLRRTCFFILRLCFYKIDIPSHSSSRQRFRELPFILTFISLTYSYLFFSHAFRKTA